MPKGRPGSGPRHEARGFLVCIRDGRFRVKQGARWRAADELTIQVTVTSATIAAGDLCLQGVGVVRCLARGAIVVTA